MRRSKLEMYIEVLNTINDGEKKPTRIMYSVNTSWKSLQGILSSLVDQELISEVDMSNIRRKRDKRTNTIFEITPKGQNVIRYFNQAKGLISVKSKKRSPLQITR
jgi:predicted transcriptional regulator